VPLAVATGARPCITVVSVCVCAVTVCAHVSAILSDFSTALPAQKAAQKTQSPTTNYKFTKN